MIRALAGFIILSCFLIIIPTARCETSIEVRTALIQFKIDLSPAQNLRGWNLISEPCDEKDQWEGTLCVGGRNRTLVGIVLDHYNLTGTLNATSLCEVKSLQVLSLSDNHLVGTVPDEISKCGSLLILYLQGNSFRGSLPPSLSELKYLIRLDISNNALTGEITSNMSRLSSLAYFSAENNRLSGHIPDFDLNNFQKFNVSNNQLRGPLPKGASRFPASSFSGNPNLCGEPVSSSCPDPGTPAPPVLVHVPILDEMSRSSGERPRLKPFIRAMAFCVLGFAFAKNV